MGSTISTTLDACAFVDRIRRDAKKAGIRLVERTDFTAVEREIAETRPDYALTPAFSARQWDLSPATAFWICGYDKKGRLAHTQAVRVDRLGSVDLETYWHQQIKRLWKKPGKNLALAARGITGTVAYHGEMWINPKIRANGLAPALCRMGMALAHLRYDPDYMYGFIVKENAIRGFATRTGYPHQEADALNWTKAPLDYEHEYMVWASREDLANLINKPAGAFQ